MMADSNSGLIPEGVQELVMEMVLALGQIQIKLEVAGALELL